MPKLTRQDAARGTTAGRSPPGGLRPRPPPSPPPAAPRTGEDILFVRPPHEVGPRAVLRAHAVRLRLLTRFVSGRRGWARPDRARLGLGTRDHLLAPRRVRRQDA